MRKYTTTRYRCDHCNFSGSSKARVLGHESRCLRNPRRTCPICELAQDLSDLDYRHDDEEIRAKVGGCPCCILAAIVRSTLHPEDEARDYFYKEELALWQATNARNAPAIETARAALEERHAEAYRAECRQIAESARNGATDWGAVNRGGYVAE